MDLGIVCSTGNIFACNNNNNNNNNLQSDVSHKFSRLTQYIMNISQVAHQLTKIQ